MQFDVPSTAMAVMVEVVCAAWYANACSPYDGGFFLVRVVMLKIKYTR